MPIKKYTYVDSPLGGRLEVETLFPGRVVALEYVAEERDLSPAADRADVATVSCTYALVWLGTHGAPPEVRGGRPAYAWGSRPGAARRLSPEEQFAWVDCTNVATWASGFALDAAADPLAAQLAHGGAAMLAALEVWRCKSTQQRGSVVP